MENASSSQNEPVISEDKPSESGGFKVVMKNPFLFGVALVRFSVLLYSQAIYGLPVFLIDYNRTVLTERI